MASTVGVHVSGLKETTRAMERAGVEVNDLKDVMGTVAAEAAETMRGFIPTRTGKLRDSTRGNRAKGNATVTVGTKRVAYAWAVSKRVPFVARTDQIMATRSVEILEAGWADIAERNGFA